MALLIDTSVFIAVERHGRSEEYLSALASVAGDQMVALASITASELLVGVHRADREERRVRREAFVEAILSMVPVVPFDLGAARVHARLLSRLHSSGASIGAHDLLIASTALAHGYGVLTANRREFDRVPGLEVKGLG